MATIYERKDLQGQTTWRVQIRRKGYPTFCLSFDTEEEATKWAKEHEPMYMQNATWYVNHADQISLTNNRRREFARSKSTT